VGDHLHLEVLIDGGEYDRCVSSAIVESSSCPTWRSEVRITLPVRRGRTHGLGVLDDDRVEIEHCVGTVRRVSSRRIAVVTLLAMMASFMGFTLYLSGSHGSDNWTLPVFVAIIVVEAMIGFAFMWKLRRR
jgi:hypothetical protein